MVPATAKHCCQLTLATEAAARGLRIYAPTSGFNNVVSSGPDAGTSGLELLPVPLLRAGIGGEARGPFNAAAYCYKSLAAVRLTTMGLPAEQCAPTSR
jgi:hypothetical protein